MYYRNHSEAFQKTSGFSSVYCRILGLGSGIWSIRNDCWQKLNEAVKSMGLQSDPGSNLHLSVYYLCDFDEIIFSRPEDEMYVRMHESCHMVNIKE